MSADPKLRIDKYYDKLFDKLENNSQYEEILPLIIALNEKILLCEKRKKKNSISKTANALFQILIGINIGIFVYSDKPFESIESKGLALATILLIVSLILSNFMGDSD